MNGIKYSKNGGINKATINSNELKMLKLIWAGVKPSKRTLLVKQSQLVSCFEREDWSSSIGINEDFPSNIQEARISPKDLANFQLPEGETNACVVVLRAMSLTAETERRLIAFGEDLKNTMGLEFRVVMWN
jgi:hypothetical protein